MNEIIDFLIEPYQEASSLHIILEIVAVMAGVMSVWYAKQENILVFPVGILSTAIYIYICFRYTLYGDVIINSYYTMMSIYGWYMWSNAKPGHELDISRSSLIDWWKAVGIFIFTALVVVTIYLYTDRFDRITDYFDTFTTGVFFAAMWLMANKKIEHWYLWIAGNIISIPLYLIKGLGFTSIQFTIFLILAYLGLKEWKASFAKKHQTV